MSLKIRLAVTVSVAVALAIALAATASWWFAARSLRAPIDDDLRVAARQVVRRGDVLADRDLLRDRPVRNLGPAQGRNPFRFQVISRDGRPLVSNTIGIDKLDAAIAAGRQGSTLRTIEDEASGTRFRAVTIPLARGGAVKFARDVTDVDQALESLRNRLFLAGVLGVGMAGGLGWFIARRITQPVIAVADAAGQLAELRDLPGRIEIDQKDEVGRLAESFNRLIGALEVSREQQRRLVADASHELRTPLTSLRMKIELLQQTPGLAPDQRQHLLDGAAAEMVALSNLVAELVDLAADPTSASEESVWTQLDDLVREVVERTRIRTGRTINASTEPCTVLARPSSLARAVSNLLDNATKYSPEETAVDVSVRRGVIEVRDRGPGIAAADRALVFDRFYRSPTARTRPGSGLGLAIVSQVAHDHGGHVQVEDALDGDGGAVLRLTLPISEEAIGS